jgi:hypothetical protein
MTNVAFVQEPYTVLNNVAGFPKYFRIFASGGGRKRSAIIINNNIDAIAIRQVSNEDATVLELRHGDVKFYGTSLYFPIDRDIESDNESMEKIIQLTKGEGIIISVDSNSRSKLWYTITNQRDKSLEKYILTRDLFLKNEDTSTPTFETMRGRGWIDLTLCNNPMVQKTSAWTCGEESCADHKIIFFNITAVRTSGTAIYFPGKRYLIKTEDWENFVIQLTTNIQSNFGCLTPSTNLPKCDEELSNKVELGTDIGESIHYFINAVAAASDSAFRVSRPVNEL